MVSVLPGSLSKNDEAVVRKLFKVIRATKFEDPVDQDAFLVESANTVLRFRPQVASFALVADLGECDFAGEILRKRQTFRERKRANTDRAHVAEGMAARIERNVALEYASNLANKSPVSPNDDVVSIPSSSDESGAEEPPRVSKPPPPSPIQAEPGHSQPSSQVRSAVLLSPHSKLGVHFGRLSLRAPPHIPPSSLLSPNLSLLDLVPDFILNQHRLPVKGGGWKRGRTVHRQPRTFPTHAPVVQSHTLRLVPLPFGPPPLSPKTNFIDDWLLSRPKCTVSPRPRKNYTGSSKPFVNPNRSTRRPIHKKPKRCYYCTASDHLVALCLLRESID
ncbi:hypothetical protein B0H13DRAFT_2306781 [Mycena leptocephala]|nr:hypothetical protein B0H13DRAFT_2306781 [Mycena leptocephala]